jgi:hypothetical protein
MALVRQNKPRYATERTKWSVLSKRARIGFTTTTFCGKIPYFHTYEREGKYTVNVQCSVQYTLLLLYLMLVMSYCA